MLSSSPTLQRRLARIRRIAGGLLLLVLSPVLPSAEEAKTPAQLKAEYQVTLREYEQALETFEAEQAKPYWQSIADKRRLRIAKRRDGQAVGLDDYVTTQPPVYAGPPRPKDPFPEPAPPPTPGTAIPVVADFLRCALEQFQFAPTLPKSEAEYKRAYARVAATAGISRDQAVRVYAFESGGNGKYDVQAGLEYDRHGARAVSTALGYNQLLNTNSVEVLAEHGDDFLANLRARPAPAGAEAAFAAKLAILQEMIAFTRKVPDDWSEHEKLANMPGGLAVHALNLDVDIGPYLQTQKLLDSIKFAGRKNRSRPLTAAELEMMNLTGDGNGFDMINISPDIRDQVPTSNFFQRRGYERNPIVVRFNTVAKLLAETNSKMDREAILSGAREMAAAFP